MKAGRFYARRQARRCISRAKLCSFSPLRPEPSCKRHPFKLSLLGFTLSGVRSLEQTGSLSQKLNLFPLRNAASGKEERIMFGIGSTELLVILVVALLVLGPKNLPKIAHTIGRAMGEFRRVSTEFQRTLNTEIALDDEKKKAQERKAAKAAEKAEPANAEAAPESENKA